MKTTAAQGWQGSFLGDTPPRMRHVSAAGGLVVAGGDGLAMLRPGAVHHGHRLLPKDAGVAAVVAAEPWTPRRYAVALRGGVTVFSGGQPDEELLRLTFTRPDLEPTHLAWAREAGESRLYLRGRDGSLLRVRPDAEAFDEIDTSPMSAIASDAAGVLATLDVIQGDVCVMRADGTLEERPLPVSLEPDEDDEPRVHLAISGGAVAYSVEGLGVGVSWGEGQGFEHCDGLMGGPIAFQGDDAIVCAYSVETTIRVSRTTRQGETTCLAEIETAWSPDATLTLDAIAWDASRRALWGASPQLGLLVLRELQNGAKSKGLLS